MENKIIAGTAQSKWYVMRVTYQRELMAKKVMDELKITNFLPTQRVRRKTPQGKMVTVEQPAIHNYIFVFAEKAVLDDLKQFKLNYLRYVMCNSIDGSRRILTVPEYQMRNFIAVAGNDEEQAEYLNLDEVHLEEGDRVRILGGPFEGVEGVYVRTNGKRGRRVVVEVAGLFAVATTTLPVALVEKIERKKTV